MRLSHGSAQSFSASFEALERRRLLAAGALDTSFAGDGTTIVHAFNTFIASDLVVQSDGKTVVVGSYEIPNGELYAVAIAVARFNLDGTMDQTFGPEGDGEFVINLTGNYDGAEAVALQPDGKIVIAGTANSRFNDGDLAVLRLDPSGTLDPTFDGDGIVIDTFGFGHAFASANAVEIDKNGQIVVAGDSNFGIPTGNKDFLMARFNPNGSLDEDFGGDGRIAFGLGADEDLRGLAIDYSGTAASNPNYGKYVVIGSMTDFGEVNDRLLVARFETDGDLDTTFDGDGSRLTSLPVGGGFADTYGAEVVVQSNGNYVAIGSSGGNMVMTRLLASGPPDTTFGSSGNSWVTTDFGGDDWGSDLFISNDGRLIAGGRSDNRPALAAFSAQGIPETSFGTNGKVVLPDVIERFGGVSLDRGPGRRFMATGGMNFFTARFLDTGANLVSIGSFDSDAAEAGQDPASVIIARTEALPTPLRVYLNVGGTARRPLGPTVGGPIDYVGADISFGDDQATTTYVDIPANQTYTVATITPNEDTATEGDETAVFALRPDASYELATPSSMTIRIVDNDGISIYPLADAHVRNGTFANTNYGTATFMETKQTTVADRTRESFIKFDTASLNVPIQNIRLRVFGRLESAAAAVPTAVYGVSNSSWTENGITWNNRPSPSTGALSSVNVGSTGESFYDFDVTSFIRSERNAGRNLISLLLRNTADSTPVTYWGSRTWNNPPRLIVNGVIAIPGGAPQVVQVFVDSTQWAAPFRQHLEDTGLGDSVWGLSVTDGAGQLTSLPWTNANRIRIRFSRDTQVAADDLMVRGVNVPVYAQATLPDGSSGFSYDSANRVATWTFQTFGLDKLMLDLEADAGGVTAPDGTPLDGEWDNSGVDTYPSGNGTSGGDFRFRLNSLPADADGNGTVTVGDLGILATNFGQSMRGPRHGDFSGDGAVTVGDLGILSTYFGRSLPTGTPAVTAATTKSSTSTTSSFSTTSLNRGNRSLRRMRIAEDVLAAGRLDD